MSAAGKSGGCLEPVASQAKSTNGWNYEIPSFQPSSANWCRRPESPSPNQPVRLLPVTEVIWQLVPLALMELPSPPGGGLSLKDRVQLMHCSPERSVWCWVMISIVMLICNYPKHISPTLQSNVARYLAACWFRFAIWNVLPWGLHAFAIPAAPPKPSYSPAVSESQQFAGFI